MGWKTRKNNKALREQARKERRLLKGKLVADVAAYLVTN